MPKTRQINQLKKGEEDPTIRPITIDIKRSIWENFKGVLNRNETLNQAIVRLIQEEIKRKGE